MDQCATFLHAPLLGFRAHLLHHDAVLVDFPDVSPGRNLRARADLVVLLVAELDPPGRDLASRPRYLSGSASPSDTETTAAAIPPSSAMVFIRVLLLHRHRTLDTCDSGWQGLRLGYARNGAGGHQEECVLERKAAIRGRRGHPPDHSASSQHHVIANARQGRRSKRIRLHEARGDEYDVGSEHGGSERRPVLQEDDATILRGALVDQPEVEVGLGWNWCGLGQIEELQEVAGDEARPEQVLHLVVIHVALALGRRVVRRVCGQVSDVIGRALQALPVADIDAVHRVGLEQVLATHHHGLVLQAEPALVDHREEEVRRFVGMGL